ncbi:sigma-70 family RNA polymerase sigma factor [Clostridium sp.]|uniref:RNA polymerase sigma factor n=1 Tax=Clostridium sp. TaxID=1506 RepID=UPI00262347DC|nr:sigma-70 family RNA polymerase sigma factor [Clostridium sp.]
MSLKAFNSYEDVNKIIEKYSTMVYKLAFARTRNEIDAEDIFQEVFLRYVKKKPLFESDEHEKAWFIRVTINCSKSLWKNIFKHNEILREKLIFEEKREEEDLLEEHLLKLPTDYRTVIHLFYYEDMRTSDIAKSLNKKESTIRMQLTRARRLLKDFMEGEVLDV